MKVGDFFYDVLVESFHPDSMSGLHGPIHIRPLPGQGLDVSLSVQCAKQLSQNHPKGTVFKLQRAKVAQRLDGGIYLSSHFRWSYEVISVPE
jgi:hypothetical protein